MSKDTAPQDHWSQHWSTDEAAECLPFYRAEKFGEETPEMIALYSKLWNDIGPGMVLSDHWGKLTAEEQAELDKAYAKEHG